MVVIPRLEERLEVVLANVRDIKNVLDRNTDVKDCEQGARVPRHGLMWEQTPTPNYIFL